MPINLLPALGAVQVNPCTTLSVMVWLTNAVLQMMPPAAGLSLGPDPVATVKFRIVLFVTEQFPYISTMPDVPDVVLLLKLEMEPATVPPIVLPEMLQAELLALYNPLIPAKTMVAELVWSSVIPPMVLFVTVQAPDPCL